MSKSPQGTSYNDLDHFKNSDKQYLFRKEWRLERKPRALVQIVHGYGEHILCYEVLADPLSQQGFLCFGHDHVGHGQSQGDRVHISDFTIFVRDVLQHTEIMRKKYPDLPVFLVGHSMGGLIAAIAAQVRVELFSGIVLIAPCLMTSPKAVGRSKRFMARIAASIAPQLVVGHLEPDKISRNPEVVKRFSTDPLMSKEMKARFGVEFMGAQNQFMANAHRFEVPFLVMQGTIDELSVPEYSQLFHEKARSRDKQIQLYPGWYHVLHNEPGEDGVRARRDIITWISDRLRARVDI